MLSIIPLSFMKWKKETSLRFSAIECIGEFIKPHLSRLYGGVVTSGNESRRESVMEERKESTRVGYIGISMLQFTKKKLLRRGSRCCRLINSFQSWPEFFCRRFDILKLLIFIGLLQFILTKDQKCQQHIGLGFPLHGKLPSLFAINFRENFFPPHPILSRKSQLVKRSQVLGR